MKGLKGVRKRFMRSEMMEDEDGPVLDVQIQGEEEPGLDIGGPQGSLPVYRGESSMGMEMPPREEMDMAALNDVPVEGPAEFDALSEAAKRVFAEHLQADDGDQVTTIGLMEEGLPKDEAQRVVELLLTEDDGGEMAMGGVGGHGR